MATGDHGLGVGNVLGCRLNPWPYRLQMALAHAPAAVLVGLLAVRLSGVGWSGPLAGAAFALVWWAFWPRHWIAAAGDALAALLVAGAARCSIRKRWLSFSALALLVIGAREVALFCILPLLPSGLRSVTLGVLPVAGVAWAVRYASYCQRILKLPMYMSHRLWAGQVAVPLVLGICLAAIRGDV